MKIRTRLPMLAGFLGVIVLIGFGLDVLAQVPTFKSSKVQEFVEIVELAVPINTTVDVFTVPNGKRLVITDVIVAFLGFENFFGATILRDGAVVSSFSIGDIGDGAVATYDHSYVSGIEFAEGAIVSINPGVANQTSNWELRGYLRTLVVLPLDGDLNGDGVVDIDDLAIAISCFGQSVATNPPCAIADVAPPPDGLVNILDVSFIGSNFTP